MTAGTARLDSEGLVQEVPGTSRRLQEHAGHGCCRDAQLNGGGRTLLGIDAGGEGRAVTFALRCKSVNRCACCAIDKRRRDRARAFMGAAMDGRVVMVTLTIDRSDLRWMDPRNRRGRVRPRTAALLNDPRARIIEESLRYQSWAWNRLRTALRDAGLGGLPWMRGVELQEAGHAHVHALFRVPDLAAFLRLRAALRGDEAVRMKVAVSDRRAGLAIRAGFGPVVDAQVARRRSDVARYITKDVAAYVTKGTAGDVQPMPRFTRRTAYAQGWAPGWVRPTPIAGFTWRLAAASESMVRDALVRSDFVIDDPDRYRVVAGGT